MSKKYALLVGIDRYDSDWVVDLSGCVADVNLVETYLRNTVGISNITKLTSSKGSSSSNSSSNDLPTFDNVVAAFEKLAKEARENDFVFIHFSGHGTRLPTRFGDLKGSTVDECLLLVRKEDRRVDYLHDVEVAYLLKEITNKGAFVTIVLDCCHSGGATRGESALRGVEDLPEEALAMRRPLRSPSVMGSSWVSNTTGPTRGASVMKHWLTSTKGVEFLAACLANQKAQEIQVSYRQWHGLLTECLIRVLQNYSHDSTALTCDMIYNLVSKEVSDHEESKCQQDVVFGGERNRSFFGTHRIEPAATTVTKVKKLRGGETQLELSAGKAHGVSKDNFFAIYAPDQRFNSVMDYNSPLAICKVTIVEKFTSEGRLVEFDDVDTSVGSEDQVRFGCKAVPQREILKNNVLAPRTARFVDNEKQNELAQELDRRLVSQSNIVKFMDSQSAFFDISHRRSGGFDVTFAPNETTARASIAVRSEADLIPYLAHLSIFYNILGLSDYSHQSGISVETIGYLPSQHKLPAARTYTKDPPRLQNLKDLTSSDPHDITADDKIGFQVRNRSHKRVFVEVLDLEPSWKASRVLPEDDDSAIQILPGEIYQFYLTMSLPAEIGDSVQPEMFDSIIVIATDSDQVNFPANILPTLDKTLKWKGLPLRDSVHGRGATARESNQWWVQRVNVRVLPRR